MQSAFPLEFNNYLFNYLQETDLYSKSTWFTPMCSQEVDKNEPMADLESMFCVTSKGVDDDRVKKYYI